MALVKQIKALKSSAQPFSHVIAVMDGGGSIEVFHALRQLLGEGVRFAAVEQTKNGIIRHTDQLGFPVVSVAGAALKKNIESYLIARSMEQYIIEILSTMNLQGKGIGIVGASGAIGKSMVNNLFGLIRKNFPTANMTFSAYNLLKSEIEGVYWQSNFFDFLSSAHIIISASGQDITRYLTIQQMRQLKEKEIYFINMGSANEFEALLKYLDTESALVKSNARGEICHGKLRIGCLGMPANLFLASQGGMSANQFDHPDDFMLTRLLMYCATIQANVLLQLGYGHCREIFKLSSVLQHCALHQCASTLLNRHPALRTQIDFFANQRELERYSDGQAPPWEVDNMLNQIFASEAFTLPFSNKMR